MQQTAYSQPSNPWQIGTRGRKSKAEVPQKMGHREVGRCQFTAQGSRGGICAFPAAPVPHEPIFLGPSLWSLAHQKKGHTKSRFGDPGVVYMIIPCAMLHDLQYPHRPFCNSMSVPLVLAERQGQCDNYTWQSLESLGCSAAICE